MIVTEDITPPTTLAPANKPGHRESSLPYLWMLIGSLSFSIMGTLTHALGPRCDWQLIALVRSLICFSIALAWALSAGVKLVVWRPRTLWLRSLAGSVSLICSFYALTRLPVADSLTLSNIFPIWVALLSWPLLGEAPGKTAWAAIACGITGVVLIQQPHLADGNLACLVAIGASFATSLAMLGLHRLHMVDVRAVVVHFSGVAVLFCLGAFWIFDHGPWPYCPANGEAVPLLLGVGLAATFGQVLLTKAFTSGAPARVSVVALSQIVFAAIFDWLCFDRALAWLSLGGMALVIAPTAWLLLRSSAAAGNDS
jgi:drug/metabolite transporter (DMT)-like permease